jgi:hypothetical protein
MKIVILLSLIMVFICPLSFSQDGWMPLSIEHEGKEYVRNLDLKQYEQKIAADIDGDGKEEAIVRFVSERENGLPVAITAVYKFDNNKKNIVKVIFGGERPEKTELFDIDEDGDPELIIYDRSSRHYTVVMICSFKDEEYQVLFENGTACLLCEVKTDVAPVRIVIGRENWENENFSYANSDRESLQEIWVWNGEKFEYSFMLSSTPIVTEKQAIEAAWQHIRRDMSKEEGQVSESDVEIMTKTWVAGGRFYQVFQEDVKPLPELSGFEYLDEEILAEQKQEQKIQKAAILFKQAIITMGQSAKSKYDIKTATQNLLRAVELDPENDDYKDFLVGVYNTYWKDIRFPDDDQGARDFIAIQKKIKGVVETLR